MSTQPVNLVSVNTAPDRAKKVIGAVIDNVKDKYAIVHAGNSTSELAGHVTPLTSAIEGVKPLLLSVQPPPGILFCASMVRRLSPRAIAGQLTTVDACGAGGDPADRA